MLQRLIDEAQNSRGRLETRGHFSKRYVSRGETCCAAAVSNSTNEKSTISISWSSLRKRKRLPCHGPVSLPFPLNTHCDLTRLPEEKPEKKYCRSDNTMFIHRNLSWYDKIFTTFMKQTCRSENVSIHFHLLLSHRRCIRYD